MNIRSLFINKFRIAKRNSQRELITELNTELRKIELKHKSEKWLHNIDLLCMKIQIFDLTTPKLLSSTCIFQVYKMTDKFSAKFEANTRKMQVHLPTWNIN